MTSPRAKGIGAGLVVALLLAAAFGYARYDLADRVASFTRAVEGLGYDRGGRLPAEPFVRAHAEAAAVAHGLELVELVVTTTDHAGLGAAGDHFQARLRQQPGPTPSLRGTMRRYDLRARVRGRKWLWSVERDLTAAAELRVEVRMDPPSRPPPPPASTAPRGLR